MKLPASATLGKAAVAVILTALVLVGGRPSLANVEQLGSMQVFRLSDFTPVMESAGKGIQEAITSTAPDEALPPGLLTMDDQVSSNFISEIENAAGTLPPGVVKALARAGYKIQLSRTVTEAVPSARNQQVRGYEPHSTWNTVFGMFNRTTRKVVMAEFAEGQKTSEPGKMTTLNNPQRRKGILRHEFGHAVDNYLGNFSHTAEFRAAYAKGKTTVSKPEAQVLAYYLQTGDAGPEETFAEIFAALKDTACDRGSDVLLKNHFPELVKLIDTKVATIK